METPQETTVIDDKSMWDALSQVMDPELNLNVVELGLIYNLELRGQRVEVKMTLTTPGCPMHQSMVQGVRLALLRVDGVEDANVEVVWDPPWNPDMMSEEVRGRLGQH